MFYVYILICSDSSYYVGHTEDLEARVKCHNKGRGAAYTRTRTPVEPVFSEQHPTIESAMARELQLKKWSKAKKDALISGDMNRLRDLSHCRSLSHGGECHEQDSVTQQHEFQTSRTQTSDELKRRIFRENFAGESMITIRQFKKSDTREIMTLFYETVHKINIRDYSPEQIDAWGPKDMDYDLWLENLSNRITFVAESDGLVVGFANSEEDGHIDRFYCHKDYQGVGVGTSLLSAIEEEAQSRGITRLFTEASITAKPFFTKRGFVVLEEQTVERRNVIFINYRMEKVFS